MLEADAILSSVAEKIVRTRKGRVWDIWIDEQDGETTTERPYFVRIEPIQVLDEEDLELLVRHGQQIDSAKERVVISAGLNLRTDYDQLEKLVRSFVSTFGGVASAAIK